MERESQVTEREKDVAWVAQVCWVEEEKGEEHVEHGS